MGRFQGIAAILAVLIRKTALKLKNARDVEQALHGGAGRPKRL